MFTPPKRVTCHMSHVTCHVLRVTCHVSRVTCHVSFFYFIYLFIFFMTKWWSLSVEGLSSTGLSRLVFEWSDFPKVQVTTESTCYPKTALRKCCWSPSHTLLHKSYPKGVQNKGGSLGHFCKKKIQKEAHVCTKVANLSS